MKEQTKDLRERLQALQYMDERLDLLKNAYKNETVYILAAGPSLNNFAVNKLREFLSNKLVFCIKQPYYNFKDVCDFLFLNFTNLSPYQFNNKSIVSWAYWFDQHPYIIQEQKWQADLLFPIFRNANIDNKISQSVAYQKDFENITFDKSIERPWGPGLMFELAIPMSIHLGCKNIVTIGWDIGDINKWKNINDAEERHYLDHFYTSETSLYDKFSVDAEEIQLVTESTTYLYNYLKTLGIEFNIVSDRNPASDMIPRLNIL